MLSVKNQKREFARLLGVANDDEIASEMPIYFENFRKLHGFILDFSDDVFFDQGMFFD